MKKGKLSTALRATRRRGRYHILPSIEPEMGSPEYAEHNLPVVKEKTLRAPERREIYKRELLSLAKHGTRTAGKTITFAHPVQTMSSVRNVRPAPGLAGGYVRGAHHWLVERQSIGPEAIRRKTSREATMREMVKARRYSKLLRRWAKKAGPLGLAVTAFDMVGRGNE